MVLEDMLREHGLRIHASTDDAEAFVLAIAGENPERRPMFDEALDWVVARLGADEQ